MDEQQALGRRFQPVDRSQSQLCPVVVERLIPEDHPARSIWEFVGHLDLSKFVEPVRALQGEPGRPALDPQLLISIWIYAATERVNSAREIERRLAYDPAFQWLAGMETISAHALSDFRTGHKAALDDLSVQVLGLLSAEGLVTLERVMQDGTKVRAAASKGRFRSRRTVQAHYEMARRMVEDLDTVTEEETTLRARRARERAAEQKQRRLESALEQFEMLAAHGSSVDRVSTTDPEARFMKQPDGGSAPSYNVQIVSDAKHGIIVDIAPTQAGVDYHQLVPAMDRMEQTLGKPRQLVVDGGYITAENIRQTAARGIELIGPAEDQRQSDRIRTREYDASRFRHDTETNTLICPQGKSLRYEAKFFRNGMVHHRYEAYANDCHSCPVKHLCSPRAKKGRSVELLEPDSEVAQYRAKMQTSEARAIYQTRAQVAEFANLWLKEKLGLRRFRLRGLCKVAVECLWAAIAHNIQQFLRLRSQPAAA